MTGLLFGTPNWTDQISLGVVILGALLTIATLSRLLFTVPTKSENTNLRRRLGDCESELSDKSRRLNELGAEKDLEAKAHSAEKARADELSRQIERLPKYQDVIRLQAEAMEHVDRKAAERQEAFLSTVINELKQHDERVSRHYDFAENQARERHEAQIEVQKAILSQLENMR